MGRFVNPDNSAFQVALNSRIYVDKTGLIEYTNSVLNTTNAYICNSRPRRFGKSYAANMLAAYYSKGADSEKMFSELEIGKNEALLPKSEQVPGETYTVGQTTKIFVVDVKEGTKGPKIMISRTHPGLVRRFWMNCVWPTRAFCHQKYLVCLMHFQESKTRQDRSSLSSLMNGMCLFVMRQLIKKHRKITSYKKGKNPVSTE